MTFELLIGLLFGTLIAATIVPTLPNSRKVRVILGIAAIPLIISVYGLVESCSSKRGAGSIDAFVEVSERILMEGKPEILLKAFQDYHSQIRDFGPSEVNAADRAHRLSSAVSLQEQMQALQSESVQSH